MPDEFLSQLYSLLWLAPFALALLATARFWRVTAVRAMVVVWPLFVLFQVTLIIALDALGMLGRPAILKVYSALTVAGLIAWAVSARRKAALPAIAPEEAPAEFVGRAALAVILALTLVKIFFTPAEVYDTQTYHLPMVANWIQNGSLDLWATQAPRQIVRTFAGEAQAYTVAVLTLSDALVELPTLVAALVLAACMAELADLARVGASLRCAAMLAPFTAIIIAFTMGTAKNDMIFAAAVMIALLAVARLAAGKENPARWAMLAALATACAVGAKVPGVTVAAAVGVLWLVALIRRRLAPKPALAALAVFAVAAVPLFLFAWVRSYRHTGWLFGLAPLDRSFSWNLLDYLREGVKVYGKRFYILLAACIHDNDNGHYGLLFAFILLPAFLWGILRSLAGRLRRVRRGPVGPAGAVMAFVILNMAIVILTSRPTHFDARWTIWLVGALAAWLLLEYGARLEKGRGVVLGLVAGLAVMSVWIAAAPSAAKCLYLTYAIGRPLRTYDTMPWTKGYDRMDDVAAPSDEVLYIGGQDTWQYPCWGPRFTRRVTGVDDADDAASTLRDGPRFVVVEDAAVADLRNAVADGLARHYAVFFEGYGRTIYEETLASGERPSSRPVRGGTRSRETP